MIKNILDKILGNTKQTVIKKEDKINIKGTLGELRQEIRLDGLPRQHYKVINNIIIPNKENTSQIDHLVISNFGIFVIENKNFKGNIYGSERSKTWTQFLGGTKNNFYNPIYQNYSHIKAIENILGTNKNIYSIIVFGEKSTLRNIEIDSEKIKVIKESDLLATINTYTDKVLTDTEVKTYFNKILESISTIKQDANKHSIDIKNKIEKSKKICPRCKSELVERKGQYGRFLGCSSYPNYKFTNKLD